MFESGLEVVGNNVLMVDRIFRSLYMLKITRKQMGRYFFMDEKSSLSEYRKDEKKDTLRNAGYLKKDSLIVRY